MSLCNERRTCENLLHHLISDHVLDQAYRWLCHARAHYHHNDDVWHVRYWWAREKPTLQAQLRAVAQQLPAHRFVFRTDVKSYYASIDHGRLFGLVQESVTDPAILALVQQYLTRVVSDGGLYTAITRGIALGCPLSPLMGALYLKPLDDRMAQLWVWYLRYVDDWVLLASTRWKLRAAIRAVNAVMADLLVIQHPEKTIIGRIARGFEFLGYRFTGDGMAAARQIIKRCRPYDFRLYEQGADGCRIGTYLQRWARWVRGGLGEIVVELACGAPCLIPAVIVAASTVELRKIV